MFHIQFKNRYEWFQICERPPNSAHWPALYLFYMMVLVEEYGPETTVLTLLSLEKFCQIDIVNVDEHDVSDISETIPNRFLLKNWIKNMCHVCF